MGKAWEREFEREARVTAWSEPLARAAAASLFRDTAGWPVERRPARPERSRQAEALGITLRLEGSPSDLTRQAAEGNVARGYLVRAVMVERDGEAGDWRHDLVSIARMELQEVCPFERPDAWASDPENLLRLQASAEAEAERQELDEQTPRAASSARRSI